MKRSLHVGINKYREQRIPRLRGCLNDMLAMQSIWAARGYQTTMLSDSAATSEAAKEWMDEALNGAISGAVDDIVITWSSHGTQIIPSEESDGDGTNEALVCYDTKAGKTSWENVLLDKEIHAWASQFSKDTRVLMVVDTCFSGGVNRRLDSAQDRFLPPISAMSAYRTHSPKLRGVLKTIRATSSAEKSMLAACREDQTSADAFIDNKWQGAFSWAYAKAVSEGYTDNRKAISRTRTLLAAKGYSQIPQILEL